MGADRIRQEYTCLTLYNAQVLSKFQGFVHGSESRIARLAHQSTGNWIGQLHATRSKPLVRDHSDTRHGIVMPRVAAEHKSEAL